MTLTTATPELQASGTRISHYERASRMADGIYHEHHHNVKVRDDAVVTRPEAAVQGKFLIEASHTPPASGIFRTAASYTSSGTGTQRFVLAVDRETQQAESVFAGAGVTFHQPPAAAGSYEFLVEATFDVQYVASANWMAFFILASIPLEPATLGIRMPETFQPDSAIGR